MPKRENDEGALKQEKAASTETGVILMFFLNDKHNQERFGYLNIQFYILEIFAHPITRMVSNLSNHAVLLNKIRVQIDRAVIPNVF